MRPPIALTIAGTDPSGGAGIQADLKTFTALGVYGTSVITALVAQNTHGVERVQGIGTDFVADQIASVLDDMPVDATKTGMLGTRELVELVCAQFAARDFGYIVVDPVMVSTSGHRLLDRDAMGAVRDQLVPAADLITPNLPEGALLLGDEVPPAAGVTEMHAQARELVVRGASAVLLKGGHLESGELFDVLAIRSGDQVETSEVCHPRIDTAHTHGTGCTLSAAIAAHIARTRANTHPPTVKPPAANPPAVNAVDAPVHPDAIRHRPSGPEVRADVSAALGYVSRAITSGAGWSLAHQQDGSHGPVNHFVDIAASAGSPPVAAGDRLDQS